MKNILKKLQSLSFGINANREEPSMEGPETIVVLKFNAHCPQCCKQVRNCIKKARGVVSVDVNSEKEEATVTGTFRVENLKAHIFKDLRKRVEIVSQTSATGEGSNDQDDEGGDGGRDDEELHVED